MNSSLCFWNVEVLHNYSTVQHCHRVNHLIFPVLRDHAGHQGTKHMGFAVCRRSRFFLLLTRHLKMPAEAPCQPAGHPLTGISKDRNLFHARVSALTHDQEAQGQHSHRTGRERPCCFTSTWREAGFVASIAMSQIFDEYLTSGFFALVPVLMRDFDLTNSSITWPASITSLVVSMFLLTFGRLTDIRGGLLVYTVEMAWSALWTLLAALSRNL